MRLIVDANILFSALIRDGITRKLICNPSLSLYAPSTIMEEFLEHIEELKEKTEGDINTITDKVEELINLNIHKVPENSFLGFISQATNISPDPDDVAYIALALKLKCAIWSNDRRLRENQTSIKIYTTKDILDMIEEDSSDGE